MQALMLLTFSSFCKISTPARFDVVLVYPTTKKTRELKETQPGRSVPLQ